MNPCYRAESLKVEDRCLVVGWADGHHSRFHHIWLRDACRCPHCGEPAFGDKRIVLSELPVDLYPAAHHISNGGSVVVRWSHDDHESIYDAVWLRDHCYSREERERRRFKPTLWHPASPPDLAPYSIEDLRSSEAVQYRLLETLHRFGIVLIDDLPPDEGVAQVASLFGYLRETNYGRVYDIKVEPMPRTFADLPQSAPLHTDDAFRVFPPGFTMLHCVQPSIDGGGASLFLDGFEVVRRLKQISCESFEVLTRLPLRFSRRHPAEHDFVYHGKMIRLDPEGEVSGIRMGLHNISPPDIDADRVEVFYEALRHIDRLVRDPGLRIVRRLGAGELALVDNERVLHGREAFDASGGRHIRGGFVDRDAFHSRWRVLSERLGRVENLNRVFPGAR